MAVDKLVDSAQLESDLTDIADAIRAKTGGTADLAFPADFVSEIGSISGGGGIDWDTLLESDSNGYRAYPTNLVLPATVKTIPRYAFYECRGLISVSGPGVTKVDRAAFGYCSNLTSVSFPSATDWTGSYQPFDVVQSITTWDIPWHRITGLNDRCFRNCSVPSALAFPNAIGTIGGECFRYDTTLQKIDFGTAVKSLANGSIFANTSLNVLILRRTRGVVTLGHVNVLNTSCPFASSSTGGTLYVPSDLISAYQSATNWSTILGYTNNSIEAIEGSQYENYYADGTQIDEHYYDMSTVTWSVSGNDARSSAIPTGDNGIVLEISTGVQIYNADTGTRITGPGVYVTEIAILPSTAANISIVGVGHKNDIETWVASTTISVRFL